MNTSVHQKTVDVQFGQPEWLLAEIESLKKLRQNVKRTFKLRLPALEQCQNEHVAQVMSDDINSRIIDDILKAAGPQRSKSVLKKLQYKLAVSEVEIRLGEIKSKIGLYNGLEAIACDTRAGEESKASPKQQSVQQKREAKMNGKREPGERWTTEEKERFFKAVRLYSRDWHKVGEQVGKLVQKIGYDQCTENLQNFEKKLFTFIESTKFILEDVFLTSVYRIFSHLLIGKTYHQVATFAHNFEKQVRRNPYIAGADILPILETKRNYGRSPDSEY